LRIEKCLKIFVWDFSEADPIEKGKKISLEKKSTEGGEGG
jgi:hypothetical protein